MASHSKFHLEQVKNLRSYDKKRKVLSLKSHHNFLLFDKYAIAMKDAKIREKNWVRYVQKLPGQHLQIFL